MGLNSLLFSTTMSVMLRTLFLVLAVGAVLSHAQPASPRLPSTWSSYVTFNSESLSLLYGAIYMDYTTNNQRADLVSLVAAQNTFFQTFDSSGTFTSETLVYTAASSGNVPGCVSYPPPSGRSRTTVTRSPSTPTSRRPASSLSSRSATPPTQSTRLSPLPGSPTHSPRAPLPSPLRSASRPMLPQTLLLPRLLLTAT